MRKRVEKSQAILALLDGFQELHLDISLTRIASKILEHIVHSHVMKHFEHYNILTNCQHGFRSKRSTELQLILTIHDIASSLQQNKSIHAAVLDFSKALMKSHIDAY